VYVYAPSSSMRLYSLAVAVETRMSLWVCKSPVVHKFTCRCEKYPSRSNSNNFKSFLFHSETQINIMQYYMLQYVCIIFVSLKPTVLLFLSLFFHYILYNRINTTIIEGALHQTRWTDIVLVFLNDLSNASSWNDIM